MEKNGITSISDPRLNQCLPSYVLRDIKIQGSVADHCTTDKEQPQVKLLSEGCLAEWLQNDIQVYQLSNVNCIVQKYCSQ